MKNCAYFAFLFFVVAACSRQMEPQSAQPQTSSTSVSGLPESQFNSWVQKFLGVEAVIASRPVTELRGDFNGDELEDQLLVIEFKAPAKEPLANAVVVRPWLQGNGVSSTGDLKDGAMVNFLVVHGAPAGSQPVVFILHDDDDISLLDAPAGQGLALIKKADIEKLGELDLASAAKGDVLAIPTEAGIDTYVYWDGGTYRLSAAISEE